MFKGFVSGLLSGIVLSAAGFVVASVVTPLPERFAPHPEPTASVPEDMTAPVSGPDAAPPLATANAPVAGPSLEPAPTAAPEVLANSGEDASPAPAGALVSEGVEGETASAEAVPGETAPGETALAETAIGVAGLDETAPSETLARKDLPGEVAPEGADSVPVMTGHADMGRLAVEGAAALEAEAAPPVAEADADFGQDLGANGSLVGTQPQAGGLEDQAQAEDPASEVAAEDTVSDVITGRPDSFVNGGLLIPTDDLAEVAADPQTLQAEAAPEGATEATPETSAENAAENTPETGPESTTLAEAEPSAPETNGLEANGQSSRATDATLSTGLSAGDEQAPAPQIGEVAALPKVENEASEAPAEPVPDLVLVIPDAAEAPTAPGIDLAAAAPANAGLSAGPQILPVPATPPSPGIVPEVSLPGTAPEAEPRPRIEPGLNRAVEGVRTDRLPQVGTSPLQQAKSEVPLGNLDAALIRNARPFVNPENKPPFVILLRDAADSGVDLAALASSDLPMTLVIDPSLPGASERAALWRGAGQEVAVLSSALPQGAFVGDIEVALEALNETVPQALAVVEAGSGGAAIGRDTAVALVPGLRERGFGMVTWDAGLRQADQVAKREGLPQARIFRDLDAKDEAEPVIRRYLDRAAFKAQQDGEVVVIGRLRPETLAALHGWSIEGRVSGLALAPLSGALQSPR